MNGIWHMLRVLTYIYMLTPLLILLLLVKFSNDNLVNSRILNWNEFLMNEMTFLMNESKTFLIKFSTVAICNFNENKVYFHTYVHFWSPLKTSENQSFSSLENSCLLQKNILFLDFLQWQFLILPLWFALWNIPTNMWSLTKNFATIALVNKITYI